MQYVCAIAVRVDDVRSDAHAQRAHLLTLEAVRTHRDFDHVCMNRHLSKRIEQRMIGHALVEDGCDVHLAACTGLFCSE